ncbi:hypothetical protein [uncultured Thermomonas sp.]|uniref:hypothetical protein n=1 Tax=uncultured Thermomonas sp. TaxID=318121 RepID=UPI002599EA18|nr:hypothetical protein [uncultured Thermomonas sp.]
MRESMAQRALIATVTSGAVLLVLALAWRLRLFAEINASWWWLLGVASVTAMLGVTYAQAGHAGWRHPARWLTLAGMLGVVAYAGIATMLACLLLMLCAAALAPRSPGAKQASEPASRIVIGLAVLVALVGWLLPFPIHTSMGYRGIAVAICVVRYQSVLAHCKDMWQGWRGLEQEAGSWLVLTVVVTCLAGLGLWLPSVSYDDNTTHLTLPYQLLRDGYFHLDVSGQVWALAPWGNNILHAIAAMLAGSEARAAVDLLWLLLGVQGAWQLARAMGASVRVALAAAALFASLPLTGYFTTTMQVDGASAAVLMRFAAMLAVSGRSLPPLLPTAALLALLAGLKASNGVYVLPALGWLAWLAVQQRQWRWLLSMLGLTVLLGGSSYVYAAWVTGSPLFPLFNASFKSPYFATINFIDQHWMAGVTWRSLWDMTFHSDRYGEHYPGAFGIALLALLPALVIEVVRRPASRAIAVWFAATGLLLFLQIQYLRYVFPATAILVVIGVLGLARALPAKLFPVALSALLVANLALVPTTVWYMHDDVWALLLRQGPAARAAIEASRAPERVVLRRILMASPQACILMTDKRAPFAATAAGRAVTTKKIQDPRVGNTAAWADEDASGQRWQQTFAVLGSSHVMTTQSPSLPLRTALQQRGFAVIDAEGAVRVWAAADSQARICRGQLETVRDEARRHFQFGSH